MNLESRTKTAEVFSNYWPWFFFTAAFESLLAILALVLIPSEGGISLGRLALLGGLSFFLIGGMYLGSRARKKPTWLAEFERTPFIVASALFALTSALILFLLRYLNPERLLPYYERLGPLFWYLLILGAQSAIFSLLVRNGLQFYELSKRRPVYRSAAIAFCSLVSLLIFIAITKIGITPDTGYWGEPGVAILGWQAVLSVFCGFILLLVGMRSSKGDGSRLTEIYIPLALYLTACGLWLSVPVGVLANSFYSPITPPTNTPFPYSDAGFYDYLAQSLLIGTDYLGGIPPRPLYVAFLAVLHFGFGQNYPAIIAAQTFMLALFPVTLYLLGKKFHSPAAGVTVALFAIFRELVGLWISSSTRVVNSKILTTDFPTALAIAILSLAATWWLHKRDLGSTLIAGGAFGVLLLFRTQSVFTLPAVFVVAWFVYGRKTKEWIRAGVVFALAMAVTVLPWLIHNYTISGRISFDDPRQVAIIYSQYSFTGNLDLNQFDPDSESAASRMLTFTLENPGYVSRFVATHFLNTEIGGLLALPLIKPFHGLTSPVNLYWVSWNGSLEWYNVALIILYVAIIAVGVGAAWRRASWVGLLPMAFNLGYAAANGISRFSSWRYNLPVDWVIYFYFGIGAIEILHGFSLLLGARPIAEAQGRQSPEPGRVSLRDLHPQHLFIMLAFVFVGSVPWIAKGLAQSRYKTTQEGLAARLELAGFAAHEIDIFLEEPQAVLLEGRMLYPRMYRRDEGMISSNPWPAYAVKNYARIGFLLLNDGRSDAIFVTRDLLDFPQGADMVLLGCQREDYIEARVIDFGDRTFQSAPLTDPCN